MPGVLVGFRANNLFVMGLTSKPLFHQKSSLQKNPRPSTCVAARELESHLSVMGLTIVWTSSLWRGELARSYRSSDPAVAR